MLHAEMISLAIFCIEEWLNVEILLHFHHLNVTLVLISVNEVESLVQNCGHFKWLFSVLQLSP